MHYGIYGDDILISSVLFLLFSVLYQEALLYPCRKRGGSAAFSLDMWLFLLGELRDMRFLNNGIGFGSYEIWRLPFWKEAILAVFMLLLALFKVL
ncbi:hypothetical protein [Bartonella pachyuromydis]|uniref:Uncharacterized protein n=1 Tax=Bartonella pachyuromydis TaxID=931097 RepID=A0ABP8VLA9_9HYPH